VVAAFATFTALTPVAAITAVITVVTVVTVLIDVILARQRVTPDVAGGSPDGA